MAASVYELRVSRDRLRILIDRTSLGNPELQTAIAIGVRRWGALLQARAVHNVSGFPVVYDGRAFVVRTRTGTLKGAIELQWPYGSAQQARVFVNGAHTSVVSEGGRSRATPVSKYAAAIEHGHPEIDLKQFMQGKIVPFFGARAAAAQGPYAATGLVKAPGEKIWGEYWRSQAFDAKLQAKGKLPVWFRKKGSKQSGVYFIAFRRVGKEGWIIPEAAPRPFMAAALQSTTKEGPQMILNSVRQALTT